MAKPKLKPDQIAGVYRYLSRAEVLVILGCSESTLKRALRAGEVPRPERWGWRSDLFRAWQERASEGRGRALGRQGQPGAGRPRPSTPPPSPGRRRSGRSASG